MINHSYIKEKQKEIFIQNNLPIDVNNLNENIYDRLMIINQKMMRYINEYGLKKIKVDQKYIDILIQEKIPAKFFDNLQLIKDKKDDNYKILSLMIQPNEYNRPLPTALDLNHISNILFNNLERINTELQKIGYDNEKTVDKLVASTEYCWKEYMNISFKEYKNMDTKDIDKDICTINMLILGDISKLNKNDIMKSLKNAQMVGRSIINYEIINLYICLLIHTKDNKRKEVAEELNKIISSCKLKEVYNLHNGKNKAYPKIFFDKIEERIRNIL